MEDSLGADLVIDASALRADLGTVDALARAALNARRLGGRVRLRDASRELRALVAFAGLDAVLPCGGEAADPPV